MTRKDHEQTSLRAQFKPTAGKTAPFGDDFPITPQTKIIFTSAPKGADLLGSRDDYIKRLTRFDRMSKLGVKDDVSEAEFLERHSRNALTWNEREKKKLISAYQKIMSKAPYLRALLPGEIYLVKTTGLEESGAAYTRSNAIFFPKTMLAASQKTLDWLTCHETFHILSRLNPEMREELYNLIGFQKCNEIKLPHSLNDRKISNPDAPINDHFIKVSASGKEHIAVPVIFSKRKEYNPDKERSFFQYLVFRLLVVEKDSHGNVRPLVKNKKPIFLDVEKTEGFYEQIGKNTDYIIHPEEILAENFSYQVYRDQKLAAAFNTREADSRILNSIGSIIRHHAERPVKTAPFTTFKNL